ncbi:MAG: nucleotide exchange factor GrpE [Coleofasciculaceae cyanobacterium]
MKEEEKQPDQTSQPQDEQAAVNQNNVMTEVEANLESDLESPLSADREEETSSTIEAELETPKVVDDLGKEVPQAKADAEAYTLLQQENEELKTQLANQTQQLDALKTQSVRIAADFDNFRKRTTKEKEELEVQVKRVTISELLAVVDNFERARTQIKPQNDGEMAIHKSYQGVYKQLVDSLKRLGVSPMRPEGQEFDPNFHEAVMREPTDEYPEGAVMEQLVRGYFLGERVLRHAMVKVAAATEPVVTSEEGMPETEEN